MSLDHPISDNAMPRAPKVTATITAQPGTPFAHAIGRIRFLSDPDTLNLLFDAFQSMGLPMGSARWAEHALARLNELYEKERTLRRVLLAHDTMTEARENCRGKLHLQQRLEITQQYQEEERRKEYRREHP